MSATLIKSFVALVPSSVLFFASIILFSKTKSVGSVLQLLGAGCLIDGVFVRSGSHKKRGGDWELVNWETALPTRLSVNLPTDLEQDIERARSTYCKFGRHSRALDQVRLCLEHKAIERKDLESHVLRVGHLWQF